LVEVISPDDLRLLSDAHDQWKSARNTSLHFTDKSKKAPCLQRGDEFGIVESSVKLRQKSVNLRNGAVKMKVTTLRHAC
jgi:hypothetical protein